jgi:hypothetical protein
MAGLEEEIDQPGGRRWPTRRKMTSKEEKDGIQGVRGW